MNESDNLVIEIETFYKEIGKNVKKRRVAKNLTQLQLTHLLGFTSVGLVSQAELYTKKQHFNLKHLFLMASILECDIQDFFKGVEIPKNINIDL